MHANVNALLGSTATFRCRRRRQAALHYSSHAETLFCGTPYARAVADRRRRRRLRYVVSAMSSLRGATTDNANIFGRHASGFVSLCKKHNIAFAFFLEKNNAETIYSHCR